MDSVGDIYTQLLLTNEKLQASIGSIATAAGLLVEAQVELAGIDELGNDMAGLRKVIHDLGVLTFNIARTSKALDTYCGPAGLGVGSIPELNVPALPGAEAAAQPASAATASTSDSDQQEPSRPSAANTPTTAKAQAEQVQDQVNALPDRYYKEDGSYIVTNDRRLDEALDEACEHTPATSPDEVRVGVVVGNGAIFSAAPQLADPDKANLDMVVLVDQNGFMQDWYDHTVEVLETSATPEEYKANIWDPDDPTCQKIQATLPEGSNGAIVTAVRLEREAVSLGEDHFLSSPERYNECKAAIANLPQVEAVVDLTKPDDVTALASSLTAINGTIPLANLTNVYEFTGESLNSTLPSLPFADDAAIVYSSHIRPPTTPDEPWAALLQPEAKHTTGLNNYLQDAQTQVNQYEAMANQSRNPHTE